MALNKKDRFSVALIHAIFYSIPFLFLINTLWALFIIISTHALIDHFSVAKYVCYTKNFIAPSENWPKWEESQPFGYSQDRPFPLVVWLYIITDNILHLIINYVCLRYL